MEIKNQLNSSLQETPIKAKKNWFIRQEFLYSLIGVLILVVILGSVYWWKEIKKTNILTDPTPNPSAIDLNKPQTLEDRGIYVLVDDGAIVDSFSGMNYVDVIKASKSFYEQHPDKDVYDFLNIFTTFPENSSQGLTHHHRIVKNIVTGIGVYKNDESKTFGSTSGKLIGVNFFNNMFSLGLSPNSENLKFNIDNITHELQHQWVLYIGDHGYCDQKTTCWMINRSSHYSQWTDSSFRRNEETYFDINFGLQGGYTWVDNKDGTFTKNFDIHQTGISPLSLYLMGLIPSSEVPNVRYIVPEDYYDTSITVKGKLVEVSIDEIIARYGERVPNVDRSQKDFKMAYILLVKKDDVVKQEDINSLIYLSEHYPEEWSRQTLGKSSINKPEE